MSALLTKEESAIALEHGWTLSDVYDLKLQRWLIVILPAVFGHPPLATAEAAASYVITLAKQGHALSIKALRMVMAGPIAKTQTKPKKEKR